VLVRCRVLTATNRVEEGLRSIYQTIEARREQAPSPARDGILAVCYLYLAIIRTFNCLNDGVYDVDDYSSEALRYSRTSGYHLTGPVTVLTPGTYMLPVAQGSPQLFEDCIQAMANAEDDLVEVMSGGYAGSTELMRAELALYQADCEAANEHAQLSIEKAYRYNQLPSVDRALFYQLRCALYRGDSAFVLDQLRQIDESQDLPPFPDHKVLHEIIKGWLYSSIGLPQKTANWLHSTFRDADFNDMISGREDIARTRYYLATHNANAALSFMENRNNPNASELIYFGKIGFAVVRTACYQMLGDTQAMLTEFTRAYELALPMHVRLPFIELGSMMQTICAQLRQMPVCTIPQDWLANIEQEASIYAGHLQKLHDLLADKDMTAPRTHFTVNELDVLNDYSLGLTQSEIAQTYDITPNEVRATLASVRSKLEVSSNMAAVQKAARLGLLK
jgi:DNA-binding CsgD family transcriptional regulator